MIFLGIYPDTEALKLARVRKEKGKIFLEALRTLPITSAGEFVNPLYNMDSILGGEPKIATCIKAKDTFIRTLEIKLTDKGKILSTLPYELESILPYPFEESVITPFIEKNEKSLSSKVHIFSTKKQIVQGHIDKMSALEINPDHVTSSVNALVRYVHFLYGENITALFFHIGREESLALCLTDGQIEISYPFDFSIHALKEALQKDEPHLSREELQEKMQLLDFFSITPKENPHVFDLLFSFEKELSRILYYFSSKPLAKEVKEMVFAGSFSPFNKLKEYLVSLLPSEICLIPAPNYKNYDEITLESYAISIGLALESAAKDGKSLQLRQNEFISEKMIKKRVKKLSLTFVASTVFFFSLTTAMNIQIKKEENALLKLCHGYFPDTEKKEMTSILSEIKMRLAKERKNAILCSDAATVSETLSYLSHHPKIQSKIGSFIPIDKIDILKIHYEIIRPPRLNTPSSPQVKIELEFSCPSSRLAKDLHESLKKGDHFIDGSKQVTWQVKDAIYKTSFYLKSKGERL